MKNTKNHKKIYMNIHLTKIMEVKNESIEKQNLNTSSHIIKKGKKTVLKHEKIEIKQN